MKKPERIKTGVKISTFEWEAEISSSEISSSETSSETSSENRRQNFRRID